MGRGLAGALIVDEAEPPTVDRDLLWTIQDWRLTEDAHIAPGFGNRMEAAMDGRVGNTVTINGRLPRTLRVRMGERVRLRLLNAATARIMALRFEGHRPIVVALDGQPCAPHEPTDGRILLGPAMRADVMLDMQGEPGRRYAVVDDFYDRLSYTLVHLAYDTVPLRPHPLDAALRLPVNPLPRPNLATAAVHEVRLQGGMMSGMAGGGMGGGMMGMGRGAGSGVDWAINGQSMTGDGSADMPPMFRIDRGRSCILDFRNETAWWHPMHLHGHSFSVLERDGATVPHDEMGRHRPRPPARARARRLRGRQPGRLDAALPRHVAPGRRADDDDQGGLMHPRALLLALSLLIPWHLAVAGEHDGDADVAIKSFGYCAECHSLQPGVNMTGPSLAGVLGRKAGSLKSFDRYSPALVNSGVIWTENSLDAWLADPTRFVAQTDMRIRGIGDAQARADLIALLRLAGPDGPTGAAAKAPEAVRPDLKGEPLERQVRTISVCGDTYRVVTADGVTHPFWENNLRFKTDQGPNGPRPGSPVIQPTGMFGDRAAVVFSRPEELASAIERNCPAQGETGK